MTEDERFIVQVKNFLACAWIGLIYGIGAAAVAGVRWSAIVIVLLASGSCYLGVGRRWLERVAPLVLFVTMLGLAGLLPTGEDLRTFANNTRIWLRG